MTDRNLWEKKQALEAQLYRQGELANADQIRTQLAGRKTLDGLREVILVNDPSVLQALVRLEMDGATGAALALVPVIQIAWADGKIQQEEKNLVLGGAGEIGLSRELDVRNLLSHWLLTPPKPTLFQAWAEYVNALKSHMVSSDLEQLGEEICKLAQGIAKAAGGVLGFGRITKDEGNALEEVAAAFGTTLKK